MHQNSGSLAKITVQNYVDFLSGLNQNPTTNLIEYGKAAFPVNLFLLKNNHLDVLRYVQWYAIHAQNLCTNPSTKIDMSKLPDTYTKDTLDGDLDRMIVEWIKEKIIMPVATVLIVVWNVLMEIVRAVRGDDLYQPVVSQTMDETS